MTLLVLADTAPIYALVDSSDQYHARANEDLRRLRAAGVKVVVAMPVLSEAYVLILRGLVERMLQTIPEEELTAHLGAERYERTAARRGYRNGFKPRTLSTRVGTLELLVPQDRGGTVSPELFSRYQRTEQALVVSLMEMYVQGVSTRKVAAITEVLCGTRFSKSQVSALAGRLDTELAAWRERPLTAPSYPYLWVDARYEHVRVDGPVISRGVLPVSGRRGDDGRRELLGIAVEAPRARPPTTPCSARSRHAAWPACAW